MTPIEKMAKAIKAESRDIYGGILTDECATHIARKAILALVEVDNADLPDVHKGAAQFSPFPDAFANARKDAFRRILRNLIEEPHSGDTDPSTRTEE